MPDYCGTLQEDGTGCGDANLGRIVRGDFLLPFSPRAGSATTGLGA